MLNGNYMNNKAEKLTDYLNWYENKEQEEYSQFRDNSNAQYSIRGNVSYTETLAGRLQLLANYKTSFSDTDSDKRTYDKSPVSDLYDQLDESLSNVFTSGYLTQSAGAGLRYAAGSHSANLRYIHTASTGHTFIVMAGATLRQDYVATVHTLPWRIKK